MNLVGDAIHNFIDGLIIAAAFLSGGVNIALGLATTVAVALHEIPQEIGDFAVLVYGGFSRAKALFYNFLIALIAVAGALVGFFLNTVAQGFMPLLLPFAAGGFLYIASSDLVPELHKEQNMKKSILSFVFFVIGLALMYALTLLK
jgi:zinc and cadmium transporter